MNWNDLFHYCDGTLVWKERKANSKGNKVFNANTAGKIAGQDDNGYIRVNYKGRKYKAHRIVWEMHNGTISENLLIDHIDRDRSNNKIENLRLVDYSHNSRNRSVRKVSATGVTGVMWKKKDLMWESNITVRGKVKYLYFGKDFFEACCRRFSAENKHGFIRP